MIGHKKLKMHKKDGEPEKRVTRSILQEATKRTENSTVGARSRPFDGFDKLTAGKLRPRAGRGAAPFQLCALCELL
jgi:hypothetical protein